MRKLISFFVLITFILSCVMPPQGFAQSLSAVSLMPAPGTQVALTSLYTPTHLKGMVINPNDPFKFDFMVYRGEEQLTLEQKQAEYPKLIKYFLAALAVPDTDQWVNLSPYEQERIIPDNFGLTEMGRDLLAQDYLLKQIAASLTNPDTDIGKQFWDGVYAKAYEKFGTTDIPTDVINKVWITPDKAVVYEKGAAVYVLENHLKVMLETDYLAMSNNQNTSEVAEPPTKWAKPGAEAGDNEAVRISKQVMREVIIPAIEKEVNEGRNFAPLRQVYSGMLLATWYKRALKESILGRLYADQGKVKGIDQDPVNNQQVYEEYVKAFKVGVFNMIKEDVDRYSQEVIPRKYFSGGTKGYDKAQIQKADPAAATQDYAEKASNIDMASTQMETKSFVDAAQGTLKFKTPQVQKLFLTGRPGKPGDLGAYLQERGDEVFNKGKASLEMAPESLRKVFLTGLDFVIRKTVVGEAKANKEQAAFQEAFDVYQAFMKEHSAEIFFSSIAEIEGIIAATSQQGVAKVAADGMTPQARLTILEKSLSNSTRLAGGHAGAQRLLMDAFQRGKEFYNVENFPEKLRTVTPEQKESEFNEVYSRYEGLVREINQVRENAKEPMIEPYTGKEMMDLIRGDLSFDAAQDVTFVPLTDKEIVASLIMKDQEAKNAYDATKSHDQARGYLTKAFQTALRLHRVDKLRETSNHPDLLKNQLKLSDVLAYQQREYALQMEGKVSAEQILMVDGIKSVVGDYAQNNFDFVPLNDKEIVASLIVTDQLAQAAYEATANNDQARGYLTKAFQTALRLHRVDKLRQTSSDPDLMKNQVKLADVLAYQQREYALQMEGKVSAEQILMVDGIKAVVGDYAQKTDPLRYLGWRDIKDERARDTRNERIANWVILGGKLVFGASAVAMAGLVMHLALKDLERNDYPVPDIKKAEIVQVYDTETGKSTPVLMYNDGSDGVVLQSDQAQNAYGGIDMNAASLDMQIRRDGAGVPLPISQQNLENIRIDGLVPVILDIKPATGVPLFS